MTAPGLPDGEQQVVEFIENSTPTPPVSSKKASLSREVAGASIKNGPGGVSF
jgi:hypothetical protein